MARITVEDCLEKISSQYDLVLLAKERTTQLNAGEKALVSTDNDKNTVLSLREIGEGKISLKVIEDSAINKLRKIKSESKELEDLEIDRDDDFDKIYKGEISKSGAAILPSKRNRKIPDRISASEKQKNIGEVDIKKTDLKVKSHPLSTENKTESIENKTESIENKTESTENKTE